MYFYTFIDFDWLILIAFCDFGWQEFCELHILNLSTDKIPIQM